MRWPSLQQTGTCAPRQTSAWGVRPFRRMYVSRAGTSLRRRHHAWTWEGAPTAQCRFPPPPPREYNYPRAISGSPKFDREMTFEDLLLPEAICAQGGSWEELLAHSEYKLATCFRKIALTCSDILYEKPRIIAAIFWQICLQKLLFSTFVNR